MSTSLPQWYTDWRNNCADLSSRTVFFVVGCQKSGTTWVEKLLNAHPNVVCVGEGHLCNRLIPLIQSAVNQFNSTSLSRGHLPAELMPNATDLLGVSRDLLDQTLSRYIASAAEPSHVRAVGDKTPEHANSIGLLRQLYPDARFLHILRDGRDGCTSGWAHLKRQGKDGAFENLAAYAAYFASKHWKPYILHARQAGRQDPARYLEVKYEDLLADPEPLATAMFGHLDVDHSAAQVRASIEAASFRSLSGGRSQGEEDASSHIRKGVAGDWKNHFDEAALAAFNEHAGDLLAELGYEKHESVPA